jgi:hypothetical protein
MLLQTAEEIALFPPALICGKKRAIVLSVFITQFNNIKFASKGDDP